MRESASHDHRHMQPGDAPGQGQEPSVARATALDIADGLQAVAAPVIAEAVSTAAMIVLAVILVPVGIVIVTVSFVVLAVIYGVVGAPSGPVASAITITWLVGVAAALFLAFRFLYRRMPRRLREGYARPMSSPRPAAPGVAPLQAAPAPPSLAELDARLAARPVPSDAPD